jgi:hypothetical protein
VNTSHGNLDRCRNLTPSVALGVFEAAMLNSNAGAYVGLAFQVQSGADTSFYTLDKSPTDCQFNYRVAGSAGTAFTDSHTFVVNELLIEKILNVTPTGGNKARVTRWFDGANKRTNSDVGLGPGAAGGIGFTQYMGGVTTDQEFLYYAIYSGTTITVTGLSGTQAFRVINKWGGVMLSSAAQSSGSASVDTALLPSGKIDGYLEVHTSTAFSSLISGGRYPAEGHTVLWGGSSYAYT